MLKSIEGDTRALVVMGWNGRGNGVLSESNFSKEVATRMSYHLVAKASGGIKMHRVPDPPAAPEQCGKIYVGERVNVLEEGMKEITFQDNDENESVSVSTSKNIQESREESNVAVTEQTDP